MNTKKAVWLLKPEKIKATLHSLSFRSETAHSVFFILGESGMMSLCCRTELPYAFVLMHTPSDTIIFGKERTVISFDGVRTELPSAMEGEIKLEKNGKMLSFSSGGRNILSIEKDAFLSSASFGLAVKGEGSVSLEVF